MAEESPAQPTNELTKRINTSLLYPRFFQLYSQLLENCAKQGGIYYATCGLRTFDEQTKLYSYGRTDKSRGIVTKAPAGWSAHNYGIAADSTRDSDDDKNNGLQPNWLIKDYKLLADEAVKLGLEPAYNWTSFKEGPHVQLPVGKYGITWTKLQEILKKDGMQGVFKFLNGFKW